MRIEKNTVVSLNFELADESGTLLEKTEAPVSYLHGGYDGIFPQVEEELHEKMVGFSCTVEMEPENAFGEIDPNLIRVEPRDLFPEEVEIGMRFEGGEEESEDMLVYTVTDVTPDKVVVDGNHPLAGMKLKFTCTVTGVRPASSEEIEHGHTHEDDDHHH
ncbi:MAG: peptidylprolyl isomerase [Burkholderiales bacterium]|nr:peptidylprolyl isomerase [Burkholderiales bacterium]